VPRMKKRVKVITASTDPYVKNLLENISEGKRVLNPQKGEKVFSQGDQADAIFFIQSGKVKITVVSAAGKEAVIAVLGARSFLGEGALVGQPPSESVQRQSSHPRAYSGSTNRRCYELFTNKLHYLRNSSRHC